MKVTLSKGEAYRILDNLKELRAGAWSDPGWSSLFSNRFLANFAGPAEAAGEVERRLSMCDIYRHPDGFITKQVLAWGETEEYVARRLNISRKEVERGVRTALDYITGKWPKSSYAKYRPKRGGKDD